MKFNLGQNTTIVADGGIYTINNTALITKNRTFTFVGGAKTAAGTVLFTAAKPSWLSNTTGVASGVKGYKVALPFTLSGQTGSVTTYVNMGAGGAGNKNTLDSYYDVNTNTANYGYIPWTGNVLGLGVRCRNPRTAGSATFVVMNGATVLTSCTLNSTDTKRINGALIASAAKPFTANNLRIKLKTTAAWQPGYTNPFAGILWVEV